jgi:HSP20 family molecular chaperone IbpA
MGNYYKGFDFGGSLDDFMQMARDFGEKMKDMAPDMGPIFDSCRSRGSGARPDNPSAHIYPPTNVYTARDGSMILEFALAGIDEKAVSVTFQGDNLVLNAKVAAREDESDEGSFSRRGFRPRDIDRQKYRVPAEDYAQDKAKAVFKNGVLTVTVPPKESESSGIKIEIVKEGK